MILEWSDLKSLLILFIILNWFIILVQLDTQFKEIIAIFHVHKGNLHQTIEDKDIAVFSNADVTYVCL